MPSDLNKIVRNRVRYFTLEDMKEKKCQPDLRLHQCSHERGRKIATVERKQTRISGALDFDRMDELRATSDAVMVGIGTVLSDNPSLTLKSRSAGKKGLPEGLRKSSQDSGGQPGAYSTRCRYFQERQRKKDNSGLTKRAPENGKVARKPGGYNLKWRRNR